MQKWIHTIVLALAVLLLVSGVPVPGAWPVQPATGQIHALHNEGGEADHSRFLQVEILALPALPAETLNTEQRHTPFRLLESHAQVFTLLVKALASRQKQYLCRATSLRPNLPSWHIAFPFLAFW